MNPRGAVVSIHRVRASRGPLEKVTEVAVEADFGLADDYRSGSGKIRQVTMIDEAALHHAARTLGRPVPDGATLRQIVMRGLDLPPLIGSTLRIGAVTLSVERDCPPCGLMDETLGPGGRDALAGRAGVCCRVIAGGVMRVGDRVSLGED